MDCTKLSRFRWPALLFCAAAVVAGLIFAAWCYREISRPVVIEGPSMAPHLCGAAWELTCPYCRWRWRRDAGQTWPAGLTVCPNCAHSANDAASLLREPERVVVDRLPRGALWQRGDVVAARINGAFVVKRIVALPGEALRMEQGDVFVDGAQPPLSLDVWRSRAIVVHDDGFRPAGMVTDPRWRPIVPASGWGTTTSGHHFTRPANAPPAIAELAYRHIRWQWGERPQAALGPVLDEDFYNAGPPRELNPVRDLGVTFTMRTVAARSIRVSIHDGREWRSAEWSAAMQTVRWRDGTAVMGEAPLTWADGREASVGVVLADGQMAVKFADQPPLIRRLEQPASGAEEFQAVPLKIGIDAQDAELRELRVWRDAVYLSPQGDVRRWDAPRTLAADEYALLGDNSPVSIDSRHWPALGVRRAALLGRVRVANKRDGE